MVILSLSLILVIIVAVVLVRTALVGPPIPFNAELPPLEEDLSGLGVSGSPAETAIERFQQAIRIPSVSHGDYGRNDRQQFSKFQDFLQQQFADFLADCELRRFDIYGLAIRWPGNDGSAPPLLYTAHYDVVPVEGQQWSVEPFAAQRKDGYIWGRGTLDTKNSLMAIIEAASRLHMSGFRPSRDIWLAFGGDEETASTEGARTISAWFAEQGIRFRWVFDEGGVLARDMVPGISGECALVGVAEKGFANIRISCDAPGGHSSVPELRTPLGRVSRAVDSIERMRRGAKIPRTMKDFLAYSAPLQKPSLKAVMANLWLFAPVVRRILWASASTRAVLHSTIAPTMAQAAASENILPVRAWANINVRIAPGDSMEKLMKRIRRRVKDPHVRVEYFHPQDCNDPILPGDVGRRDEFLEEVRRALKGNRAALTVLPYLMTGATDSKYYAPVAQEVYRFVPMSLSSDELDLLHSPDERIGEENYLRMISFYRDHMALYCEKPVGGQQ